MYIMFVDLVRCPTERRRRTVRTMPSVGVRYIVDDVDAAIAFYCDRLGFHEVMHPAPTFAMLSRGELRLALSAPGGGPGGGGRAMPDGAVPDPGRLEPDPARGRRPRRDGGGAARRRRDVPQRDRRGRRRPPDPASRIRRATPSSCSSRCGPRPRSTADAATHPIASADARARRRQGGRRGDRRRPGARRGAGPRRTLISLQRSVGNRAVRRILARDAWSEAVKYDKWVDAAKALGDLKDKDVNERLGQLNVGQLGALLGGTRDWGTDGAGETVWDPKTNARIRELIYAHRKGRTFVTFTAAGKVPTGKLGSAIKGSNDTGMQIELYYLPDPAKVDASRDRVRPDRAPAEGRRQRRPGQRAGLLRRSHHAQRLAHRRVRGGHLRLLRDEGRQPAVDHPPLVPERADDPLLHARHPGHHRGRALRGRGGAGADVGGRRGQGLRLDDLGDDQGRRPGDHRHRRLQAGAVGGLQGRRGRVERPGQLPGKKANLGQLLLPTIK